MVQNNETSKNYLCSYSQGQETFDWILLQMLAAVIFTTILVSNSLVMWRIFSSNSRKRTSAMFILISITDLIVALISIPLFYTTLFNVNHSLPFFSRLSFGRISNGCSCLFFLVRDRYYNPR